MSLPRPERAAIALGSNLGDRLATLRAARDRLRERAAPGEAFLQSSIYRTEPVGCPEGSPDFFNAVIEIGWPGTALELLAALQEIEFALGRVRGGLANEPRTLDLDLLALADHTLAHPDLVLPHPRLGRRRFVLEPLAEIRPDLRPPGLGDSVAGRLAALDGPPIERVHASW